MFAPKNKANESILNDKQNTHNVLQDSRRREHKELLQYNMKR